MGRCKKSDGTALTVTTQENAIKRTLDERFAIPLDFEFFKHPVYPYGLKEDLIVRLELNSSEKVILCTRDTSATYKLSDILLEFDAIFDKSYASSISEMYTGTTSILYTKVTSIHYQTLFKKDTTWKIDVNNLSVCSLQGLLLLLRGKRDDCANKNDEVYNQSIKKVLVALMACPINSLRLDYRQERVIYPELSKYFYKEHSDVTWEDFLTAELALWTDTRSSIDNTLHSSGRAEQSGILLQIEKAPEASGDLMCYVFSLGDAVAHLSVTNPCGILTVEK